MGGHVGWICKLSYNVVSLLTCFRVYVLKRAVFRTHLNSSGGMWQGDFSLLLLQTFVQKCVVFFSESNSFRKNLQKMHQAIIFAIFCGQKIKKLQKIASKEWFFANISAKNCSEQRKEIKQGARKKSSKQRKETM